MLGFLKKNKNDEKAILENRRRVTPAERSSSAEQSESSETVTAEKSALRGVAVHMLQLAVAAGLTMGVVFIGIAAYRHATTSDYFKFDDAEISGNSRLTDEEVLRAAGLVLGENIFETDTAKARSGLLQNSWIESAEVVRRLPGTVKIRITERKARALVNLDVLYLVDDMGRVFKRWVRGDPVPAPIVTGISREEYLQSSSEIESILCDALDLADRYARVGLERTMPLQEIYREPDTGFSLTVGEDPVYVRFGKGPYKKKLRRLAQLFHRMAGENRRAGQVFFDNEIRPDRITVKLKPEAKGQREEEAEAVRVESKKIVSKI